MQHSWENKCEQMEDIEFESVSLCPGFLLPADIRFHAYQNEGKYYEHFISLLNIWAFQSLGYVPKIRIINQTSVSQNVGKVMLGIGGDACWLGTDCNRGVVKF